MRVAIAFGTRPEVIKIAPVYKEFKDKGLNPLMIATAQHREMMDTMLEVFGIKPDIDMNIMTHNQSLNAVASRILKNMDEILSQREIDILLVQGDTTSAMASALAAFHMGIRIAHIEAGLRSGNPRDPFPEEMNRMLIDRLADFTFAPTRRAKENLLKEGICEKKIFITGNTVVDAMKIIRERFNLSTIEYENYILVTMHRRENWGEKMRSVLAALKYFSKEHNLKIVFPVHKNPKVREVVYEALGNCENAILIEPVDYIKFLSLLENCVFVVTDSGGVQEEAPSFGKFVVVVRETTERPELIENRWGILAGTSKEKVYQSLEKALKFSPKKLKNPFGDGRASQRIVDIILNEGIKD